MNCFINIKQKKKILNSGKKITKDKYLANMSGNILFEKLIIFLLDIGAH